MSENWRVDRVEEIRKLITQGEPDVVEERKWRKPSNPDGVPAFSLDDPAGLFNASLDAPAGRSIDLYENDRLDGAAFRELIHEAVRVNRGH